MAFESSTDHAQDEFGLSVLASTLAHEIRNPLQAMRIQIDMAKRGLNPEQMIEEISTGLDRLERVVQNVQKISKTYKLDAQPVNLRELLDSVLSSYRFWLKANNIELIESIQWEGEPVCELDAEFFAQVLVNLIRNAIQAMKDGGRLNVCISECDQAAQIEICDTGSGMSKDELKRVGTPFYTTKSDGAGVGLAFCKSIISIHGGSFDIDSVEGQGTCVNLQVPKVQS